MTVSPMMKHYLEIKDAYKDCIIFYRLGDFYEMFFDDAIKASKLLDLTLTGRDCGMNERAPMCGIPYHAKDSYIAKLVELGEKVAICEQLSDPQEKGLVDRDVIRVVTAGTLIEDTLLDEKVNNFICAVYCHSDTEFALAWADITTGEFFASEYIGAKSRDNLIDNLVKLNPSEIIANEKMYHLSIDLAVVTHQVLPKFYCYNEWAFGCISAENSLKKQFNVLSLKAFGLENKKLAISASGALIEYLKETQKHSLTNINKVKFIEHSEYMLLDYNAIKNLELVKTLNDGKKFGTLLWLLDKTKTGMGARNLYSWLIQPLLLEEKINYRLNGVEELFNNTLIRQSLNDLLKIIRDIERLSGKISNGNIMPRDCVALATSLDVIPSIKFQLNGFNSKIINDISNHIYDLAELQKLLNDSIIENPPTNLKDGGYIKSGFREELDNLRNISKNGKDIIAKIEQDEREKTGIKGLKIGFNRVFGYYIEVTNSYKSQVPYDYIRKQTIANAERYITNELKDTEEKILTSEEKSLKLELQIFNEIKEILGEYIPKLQITSKAIAVLDTINSLATVAKENKYVKPEILDKNGELNIIDGRHPVVEKVSKEQFVANDTYLDNTNNRTMILTGPNMAGKSTYMRQVALITLMAHIGSFVPAKSAKIPLTDKIYTRVGASDNLILDQSTFMVEMSEVATIINGATSSSLLILDEVGRGTSTYDGLSIAWAVVEYITQNIKAKTLFATHYHELTELEGVIDGVKNFKVTVKELNNSIVFLRKIMRGGANKSFGIEVAALAGISSVITERAKKILKKLEKADITVNKKDKEEDKVQISENEQDVLKTLLELNLDNLTPIEAFNVLVEMENKLKNK